MSRKELLQQEHEGRVDRTRVESSLPPLGAGRRRSYARTVWLLILLLGVAAWAGWQLCGGRGL